MTIRYRMLQDAVTEPEAVAGRLVYSCAHSTYGLADDDSYATGVPHIAVTLNSDGSYPFFTVPESSVEQVYDAKETCMTETATAFLERIAAAHNFETLEAVYAEILAHYGVQHLAQLSWHEAAYEMYEWQHGKNAEAFQVLLGASNRWMQIEHMYIETGELADARSDHDQRA